jgi:hypothetical protein
LARSSVRQFRALLEILTRDSRGKRYHFAATDQSHPLRDIPRDSRCRATALTVRPRR